MPDSSSLIVLLTLPIDTSVSAGSNRLRLMAMTRASSLSAGEKHVSTT